MPRTCLPYMFLSFMTPNNVLRFVLVGEQLEGERLLGLEVLVRSDAVARDAEHDAAGLDELFVEVAELLAFGGAPRRAVPG